MSNISKFGVSQDNITHSRGYQSPTDFVDLPSQGKFYPKESPLYGVDKVEVSFMTAKEEDLLVSPSLQKAGLTVDRVIESLLIDKRIKAKDLLVGDKNAILMNARKNAFGDNYEFSYQCQKCKMFNKHTESFDNMTIKDIQSDEECYITEDGTIGMKLPKTGATLELKLLCGEDELAIEQTIEKKIKNNLPSEPLLTRYRYMILSVNGSSDLEKIVSFATSMPIMDSIFLKKRYAKMNPDLIFEYSDECKNCKHINTGGGPIMADFFSPEL